MDRKGSWGRNSTNSGCVSQLSSWAEPGATEARVSAQRTGLGTKIPQRHRQKIYKARVGGSSCLLLTWTLIPQHQQDKSSGNSRTRGLSSLAIRWLRLPQKSGQAEQAYSWGAEGCAGKLALQLQMSNSWSRNSADSRQFTVSDCPHLQDEQFPATLADAVGVLPTLLSALPSCFQFRDWKHFAASTCYCAWDFLLWHRVLTTPPG